MFGRCQFQTLPAQALLPESTFDNTEATFFPLSRLRRAGPPLTDTARAPLGAGTRPLHCPWIPGPSFLPTTITYFCSAPHPHPRLRDLIFNDKLNLKTLIPPTKCPLSTHLLRWDQMTHNKALSLVRYPHFSDEKWGLKDVQRPAGDYTTEGLSSLRHSGPKTLFPSPLCLKKTQNAF